jgi:Cu+-exporting ATPase
MSTDPVCGMEVYENMAPASISHEGVTYFFCSQACYGTFRDGPSKYVDGSAERPTRVA